MNCKEIVVGGAAAGFGLGAAVASAAFGYLATSSRISSAALTCLRAQAVTSTNLFQIAKQITGLVLPTTALTEVGAFGCDLVVIAYKSSTVLCIGTGLMAAGSFAFAFTRCFSVKVKRE